MASASVFQGFGQVGAMSEQQAPAQFRLHRDDLPEGFEAGDAVAVDCEAMGLRHARDRLCMVQLSRGDGVAHLVRVAREAAPAPRLCRVLADRKVLKIFHFGRFDIASLCATYGVLAQPVYCTRTASLFARTFSDRHSLQTLAEDLLGIKLDKAEQSTDWGAPTLTDAQLQYAANDVLHLHALRDALDRMLRREGREDLVAGCCAFLPVRARIDLAGWRHVDVFEHGAVP